MPKIAHGGEIDRYNLHFFIRVAKAGSTPGTVDFAKKMTIYSLLMVGIVNLAISH